MNNLHEKYFRAWILSRQLNYATSRLVDLEARKLGSSIARIQIVYLLKHYRGVITPSKLARWLLRSPNNMSEILIRMEEDGLLRRVRDQKDHRKVRVEIDEEGESLYQEQVHTPIIDRIMSNLSEEQVDESIKVTQLLYEAALKELRQYGADRAYALGQIRSKKGKRSAKKS